MKFTARSLGCVLSVCLAVLASSDVLAKKNSDFRLQGQSAPAVGSNSKKVLKSAWQTQLKAGSPAKRYAPELSDPVFSEGILYVGTQGGIFYAIAADSGEKLWEYQNDDAIATRAAVSATAVFFVDAGGHLHALSKTGAPLWQVDLQKEVLNPPVFAGERLYLLKGEKDVACYSTTSGQMLWSTPIATFVKKLTMRGQAKLLLDGTTLVAALADGQIYGLDALNGALRWSKAVAPQLSTFKDIDAEIVTDGDAYYVAGYFGQVQKLARASKDTLWTLDVGSGVAPLLHENAIIVADVQGELHAFDKTSGAALWANELKGHVLSEPVAIGDGIYVSSLKGEGYLLNPATGDVWQNLHLPAGAISRPLVAGDTLYILGNTGTLAAYQWQP